MGGMSGKPLSGKEMMPTTRFLGQVLRQHRERLGLSLEKVAALAGITQVALHNLETGKASSKSDTYERVSDAMAMMYPLVILEAFLLGNKGSVVL